MTDHQAEAIRLCHPDVGDEELEAIGRVLKSGVYTNGPRTAEFEQVFAERHGCSHAVAFANGTVALQALYLALGIGPGDEVITPSMTFISSATSILHVGATPAFADVDYETFNIDPDSVARVLSPKTKAILAVHYGGQAADMAELEAIADDAGVHLIEDAAEAHGAAYRDRPVGSWGTAGMFSFTPTKNITTGEGGMLTTDDEDLAARLRLLRNHGQASPYEHVTLGYNWRITEMQAAMGIVQLGRLDGILKRKRANADVLLPLLEEIPGVRGPITKSDRTHVYMLFTLLVDAGRDALLDALSAERIEAKLYFPPAHLQQVFEGVDADLPVTEDLARRMLSVPFHSRLTHEDLLRIASVLRTALQNL